jgi:asparagine synthase (glutamine-hydrolysing)
MIGRYLLVIGGSLDQPLDRLKDRVRHHLPRAFASRAAHLFASDNMPVMPLEQIDGWLLGALFSADGRTHVPALPPSGQLAVMSTNGRHLVRSYSGSYVALWSPRQSTEANVLRDPSATMPALTMVFDEVTLVASDLDILALATDRLLEIDWPAVAHRLRYPTLPSARTCIRGLTEILPGQLVSWRSGPPTSYQIWAPGDFGYSIDSPTDHLADARPLADVVDAVVAGWASLHPSLILELSGGLDSSILAASLARTSSTWTAVTLATRGADGDERNFARLVASQFGAPLAELMIDDGMIDILDPPARLTGQPGGVGLLRKVDRLLADQADGARADAIVSGTGGDNVFCSITSVTPILDAWAAGGASLARRAASDLAALTGTTAWDVAAHLARRLCRQAVVRTDWVADDQFLARHARLRPDPHPWLDLPADAPAGLRAHVSALLRIHPVLDAHDRVADHQMIFPLLSQPVMQWCLSRPTWAWIAGGRNRALARSAFAGRLPDDILKRVQKGRLESAFLPAYDRGRRQLAELLGEGLLSDAGLIDCASIMKAVEQPASAHDTISSRLLFLVDAELWARMIAGRGGVRPAR